MLSLWEASGIPSFRKGQGKEPRALCRLTCRSSQTQEPPFPSPINSLTSVTKVRAFCLRAFSISLCGVGATSPSLTPYSQAHASLGPGLFARLDCLWAHPHPRKYVRGPLTPLRALLFPLVSLLRTFLNMMMLLMVHIFQSYMSRLGCTRGL